MENIYYNQKNPAFLGNLEALFQQTKNTKSRNKIKTFLNTQRTHTLHAKIEKKFPRNHYNIYGANRLMEIDLIDLSKLKKINDNTTFLLAAIDVFSKKGFLEPLKTKSGLDVTKAFRKILQKTEKPPLTIQSDAGKEFKNQTFQKLLFHKGIQQNFNMTSSNFKNAVVERFIRTIKEKIFKFLTYSGQNRYIDALQDILNAYNNTVHSATKFKPNDVNESNTYMVYSNIKKRYGKNDKKQSIFFNEGDFVRVAIKQNIFGKGYTGSWSKEIFIVEKVIYKNPYHLYIISDLFGKRVEKKLYSKQIQKIHIPPGTDIILKERNWNNEKTLLVYREGKRLWIPARQLKNKNIKNA
jgi:Integrase core domain